MDDLIALSKNLLTSLGLAYHPQHNVAKVKSNIILFIMGDKSQSTSSFIKLCLIQHENGGLKN